MKKRSFTHLVLGTLALATGLVSCKKCQDCTKNGDTYTVCESDYANKSAYKAYIKLLESYGYKCK